VAASPLAINTGQLRRLPVSLTKHQERVGHAPTSPTERKAPRWNASQAGCGDERRKGKLSMTQDLHLLPAEHVGTISSVIPAATDPKAGESRCPNAHNSAIPPRCPALMFAPCSHYSTEASWNEYCITCGVRHAPFRIYWYSSRMDSKKVHIAKNYCGFCGAKMVSGRASR